jgi:hypothetical protein
MCGKDEKLIQNFGPTVSEYTGLPVLRLVGHFECRVGEPCFIKAGNSKIS